MIRVWVGSAQGKRHPLVLPRDLIVLAPDGAPALRAPPDDIGRPQRAEVQAHLPGAAEWSCHDTSADPGRLAAPHPKA